ncbi:MAG TPA: electron transfer flavoprotein subunit alpha/FixB family protein [Terriglobales bacterium]|nr:electron transfer flavoprotein subunit alpha/FixB family protein [Terriglobales bacterium]
MRVFAYIEHKAGAPDDTAAELQAAAKRIDAAAAPVAIVTGAGAELDAACAAAAEMYSEVWKVGNSALEYPNAELVRQAVVAVVPRGSVVLMPHDHFGIDLAPGLAVKLGAAYVPDVVAIEVVAGTELKAVRQEFGGQVSTHVVADISAGAVLTVRPGAFQAGGAYPAEGGRGTEAREVARGPSHANILDKSAEVGALVAKRRYLGRIAAEAGDVDITRQPLLVSIGRGIQEQDNIAIAEELAEALGAVVSCSRPVVDAKWLPKSRQVGTSGKTVKPKVYLACGISGAFQHLAGLKGNPFLIAINKNPKAPIFQVADVGVVADLLEFLPVLTEKAREMRLTAK